MGKVLFIASVYAHLAAFHKPYMKMLQEKGHNVYAAAAPFEKPMNEIKDLGVKCWEVSFARSPYGLSNIKAYKQLKILLQENYFELIHVHTPVAAFMTRYLARVTGQGQVLYTAHGFHFYKGASVINWLLYYNVERLASRWTHGLIVMNEEDFHNAQKLGFKPKENLFYVHGVGVDLDTFSANLSTNKIRDELKISHEDIIITCVGELIPRKNHIFLLKAWQRLSEKYPNIHLVLAGSGKLKERLNQFVAHQKMSRVMFLGFREDVHKVIQDSDIVTLVSKQEGLPRCIMEAMACGKPVVASDIRGSRDLVENGRTGLVVSLNDVDKLVGAFEVLLKDEYLRKSMGRAGREKIENYSLEKVLSQMGAIYDGFLKPLGGK